MSLNFANNEVGYFNDIYMLSNNGQSSIYDVFYQKDDPTNNIITQEELDTALLTKANTITLNNYMVNTNTSLSLKAPIENPSFTGTLCAPIISLNGVNLQTTLESKATLATLTKSSVGISNVDNTSDANKPVSTATAAELLLKANNSSPTFTN